MVRYIWSCVYSFVMNLTSEGTYLDTRELLIKSNIWLASRLGQHHESYALNYREVEAFYAPFESQAKCGFEPLTIGSVSKCRTNELSCTLRLTNAWS